MEVHKLLLGILLYYLHKIAIFAQSKFYKIFL